jgi:leucine dehydrogenase
MELFSTLETMGHEQVVFFQHKESGLKAIVAIHNTVLGPALGGLRMWPYHSEQEALTDVLRLSKGMTYKAAVSGLNLGGGKSVIIGDPAQKSEALFRAFGRFIQALGGRYVTAEDVNTSVPDMEYIFQETDYVTGVHPMHGGSGDPSPFTALGVINGIKACLNKRYGHTDLKQASYAVQGLGHVGHQVVKHLRDADAKVFVTDMNRERIDACVALGAEAVTMDDIYSVNAKVYVPCALGATVNEKTIPQFKFEIVAGAANNQLATDACGDALHEKGILYAPDYAINAGGLMNVSIELQGYDRERANRMVTGIYNIIGNIFKLAEREKIPTYKAADRLAEVRIAAIARVKMPTVNQPYERHFAGRRNGKH